MPQFYEILVKARDDASGVFQKVAREAESASRRVSKAAEPKTGLAGLKQTFGEDSGFGLGAKTLVGAGALAGVSFLGNKFADLGKAVESYAEQYREGKITAYDLQQKIAESIPVIGGFIEGATALGDAMWEASDAMAEFRDVTQRAQQADRDAEVRAANKKKQEERDAAREDVLGEIERRGQMRGLTGFDAERAAASEQLRRDTERARELQKKSPNDIIGEELELAAQADYEKALSDIQRREQEAREQAYREHEKRITEIQADAHEQNLRNAGKEFEADRARINRQYDAMNTAVDSRYAGDMTPIGAGFAMAEAAREKAAIDAKRQADLEAVNKRQKETEDSRVDAALDDFFGKMEREADLFRDSGLSTQFASAVESRGTGVGAAGRRSPEVDALREVASLQAETRDAVSEGLGKLGDRLEGIAGYDGVNA